MIEGCWIDGSDMPPPASMVWRTDPARPGVLVGEWRIEIQGDVDAVDFELAPQRAEMQVCVRNRGRSPVCAPAVLDHATARDVERNAWVFSADADSLELGSTEGYGPFFWGRRGDCSP